MSDDAGFEPPDVLGSYEQQGFDRGYFRAVGDVLATLVLAREQFLRDNPGADVDAVREFEQYLNGQLRSLSRSQGRESIGQDPEYMI